MADNKGLSFEWCVYYLIMQVLPDKKTRDGIFPQAQARYKQAQPAVKKAARSAVNMVKKEYGETEDVKKLSGGDEPKTDLIIWAGGKKLKCSLKYNKKVQLSSAGVKTSVKFLTGVLENLRLNERYNKKQITQIISTLASFEEEYGAIGTLPRYQIDEHFAKAERYDTLLKNILGTRKEPKVSEEYAKLKLAIVEEALTGKYTFGARSDKTANHILTEKECTKIDKKFVKDIADDTSVRLALKGRSKKIIAGAEVRLNEIVVRFDSG